MNNQQLFAEITAEDAATINGGFNFFKPVSNWIQEQAARKAAEIRRQIQLIQRFRQTGRFW